MEQLRIYANDLPVCELIADAVFAEPCIKLVDCTIGTLRGIGTIEVSRTPVDVSERKFNRIQRLFNVLLLEEEVRKLGEVVSISIVFRTG